MVHSEDICMRIIWNWLMWKESISPVWEANMWRKRYTIVRALLLEVREELKSGGDEIFIDTSVPETAPPSLQADAAAVPDAPPAAEESVEGPAVPRFLQREIPIPPQPATAAPRFDLPEEAARTEEPTATPEPEQPRRPVIVEQSLF